MVRLLTKLFRCGRLLCTCSLLFGLEQSALGAEPVVVTYPKLDGGKAYNNRLAYFESLLALALESSDLPFVLKPYGLPMSNADRNRQNLQQRVYDVAWIHTTPALEGSLTAVKIPLMKGLIGWRLMFVRAEDVAAFQQVESVEDLRNLVAGQGYDYPDNSILTAAGLELRTGLHRDNVVQMLLKNRVDYFPRSITEIYDEWSLLGEPGLAIEQHLVLRYPSAFYFFVRRGDEQLATALTKGLRTAHENGSFDALFMKHFGEYIRHSNLERRKVISIPYPRLDERVEQDKDGYWYKLKDKRAAPVAHR
ncbi:transporter substrate-binding domain-containing protein [Teredinibacter turnerae]|uniref:transporter substrate-binding domain-containing protein n=1 Tax=Teredinibacter turnerae TaxID=2426 RepID=UPI0004768BD0